MNSTITEAFIFSLMNYSVSFMSDIALNDLTIKYNFFPSLRSYFAGQSIMLSGNAAGLTIVFALIINMFISFYLFGFASPNNNKELMYFCILAFILGYIIDIFIFKAKIFGNRLNTYYKENGAGFWGATAYLFSIIISYLSQKSICLYCKN